LRAVESNIAMAPIKGFGCGRFAVTQHRGLLNDGANFRNEPAHLKKTARTSSIVERGADGNAPLRLSPLPTVCSATAVQDTNGLDYALAEAALFASET
jgi:hypothetical protein